MDVLSKASQDTLTWATMSLLSLTYAILVVFVVLDIFPHLNLVTLKMRNRIRKVFGYPPIEKMSQREVNMNRSMRRERANILRRLKGNAALIMGKNTAVTFLRGCRRLPLDHNTSSTRNSNRRRCRLCWRFCKLLKSVPSVSAWLRIVKFQKFSALKPKKLTTLKSSSGRLLVNFATFLTLGNSTSFA